MISSELSGFCTAGQFGYPRTRVKEGRSGLVARLAQNQKQKQLTATKSKNPHAHSRATTPIFTSKSADKQIRAESKQG